MDVGQDIDVKLDDFAGSQRLGLIVGVDVRGRAFLELRSSFDAMPSSHPLADQCCPGIEGALEHDLLAVTGKYAQPSGDCRRPA